MWSPLLLEEPRRRQHTHAERVHSCHHTHAENVFIHANTHRPLACESAVAAAQGAATVLHWFLTSPTSGRDVDRRAGDGRTPLLIAVQHGHFDVVATLLDANVPVNIREDTTANR